MASKYVEDRVEAFLEAQWSACPVFMENERGEAPAGGSPFLILQFPASGDKRLSVTTRQYVEEGGIRIVINVERNSGNDKIRQWGEELSNLFRNTKIEDVECLVPTEPFTDNASEEGNYFFGTLIVPFQRFYTG